MKMETPQKRNGGQTPTKTARKCYENMNAKSPKQRGQFAIEKKSWSKIPNK